MKKVKHKTKWADAMKLRKKCTVNYIAHDINALGARKLAVRGNWPIYEIGCPLIRCSSRLNAYPNLP